VATLTRGTSKIFNVLDADDTRSAIEVCRKLGAEVTCEKNSGGGLDCVVTSAGTPLRNVASEIFTGNSGITTTFTIPILGLRNDQNPIMLTCGEQMRTRPLEPIIKAARELGMQIETENLTCPLTISGTLHGGKVSLESPNSQYLSALLLSLPLADGDSVIEVKNLEERPYVEMTLGYLNEQHIEYTHTHGDNIDTFSVRGNQSYSPFEKTIPGDFSSASYLIAAAVLIPGKVKIHGLDMADSQGDKRFIETLQSMGANIEIKENALAISGGKELHGTTIDCSDTPDLLPILAVIGTRATGETLLQNIGHARIKETDRLKSMATELRKMGALIEEGETYLKITPSHIHGAELHGHHDHRTIMALAVAGLIANTDTETTIDTTENVSKTFPKFIETMNSLGANIVSTPLHIVLVGFKNTGKSVVGKLLSEKLNRPFIDLDDIIIEEEMKASGTKKTCREIMEEQGEAEFRKLESLALSKIMSSEKPLVVAVGGGVPMLQENREVLAQHYVVHISAVKSIVFERIMAGGKPAFFPAGDLSENFEKLWNEREPVFKSLANLTILNDKSIEMTVEKILAQPPFILFA
jgi:3-phosphoshikimate 1-carboxyvinyltransferase